MTAGRPEAPARLVVLAAVITALLAVAVAYATLTPVPPAAVRVQHLDKVAHAVAFFALVLPLASVLTARASVLAVVALAILYGAAIELVQPRVGRGAEWGDLLADATGALAGAALGRWLRPRLLARFSRRAVGSAGSCPSPSSAAPR